MPDIMQVLSSLDEHDRMVYQQHRTEMRRSYITAHNSAVGVAAWDASDDRFLDYIDIALAIIFERSGRLAATKDIIGKSDADRVEEELAKVNQKIVSSNGVDKSQASAMITTQSNWK